MMRDDEEDGDSGDATAAQEGEWGGGAAAAQKGEGGKGTTPPAPSVAAFHSPLYLLSSPRLPTRATVLP